MRALGIALSLIVLAAPAWAQPPQEITLELIMSDPDWIGNAPENPYWADDGRSIYYEQKRTGEEARDLVHVDLEGNVLGVVEDAERGRADVGAGDWSHDRRFKVYSREGDVYVKDVGGGTIRQLTRTVEAETDPHFLAGDRRVAYRRGNDVFVRDLDSGLEYQAADLQLTDDPAEQEPPEDYLARQQPRLLDWVREQQEEEERERERERAARRHDPTRVPPPFFLGDDVEILGGHLAPSGDWMLLGVADEDRDEGRRDHMPSYVSADGYVALEEVRPKVGTGDGKGHRLLVLDLDAHRRFELDLSGLPGIQDDPLAALKRKREGEDDEGEGDEGEDEDEEADGDAEDGEDGTRQVHIGDVKLAPDGEHAAVMLRSVDNKDRWIVLVERPGEAGVDDTIQARGVHHLHDPGWINWSFNEFGWFEDGRRLWFLSEETGYSQLYVHSLVDGATRRLTTGDFLVDEPALGPDERHLYYVANPDHPGIYEIYRVPVAGGASEQLTRLGGVNSFVLSPEGDRLLVTHSTTTMPPELYLADLDGALPVSSPRRLTHTVSETFASLSWVAPEIVAVPSSHVDRPIWSRFYPTAGDATRAADGRRAAVIFVHGAGYLQNAHQGWSGYFREFLFHTFLTRHGYLVLDMDYRGSRGYGRDWRTAIYRHMGKPEVEDLEDGVAWLVERHDVDPERVGVYGGSYGGFLTFMALFTEPDLFACGAALRPVTDWAHYNHPYTSNILNTPDVDPEAFERSSPIEYAAGLTKPLLIAAGMQDDNVLFQDTVRLVQRLIELEKEDWEVAIYPIEPHAFREPESWLDEYRRIFKLFQTHLAP